MTVLAAEEAAKVVSSARAKGARPAKGARTSSDPRTTAPGSPAAGQRDSIEKIKASRPTDPPAPAPSSAPAPAVTASGGPSLPVMPAAAQTGSGFLLGLVAWAFGLAYLRGGIPEVRRLAAAKFLNVTTTGA